MSFGKNINWPSTQNTIGSCFKIILASSGVTRGWSQGGQAWLRGPLTVIQVYVVIVTLPKISHSCLK